MSGPAFDGVAEDYDRQFTDTETGALQRAVVREWLRGWLSGQDRPRILELNCGTGADAAWLGSQGAEVLATDVSPEMVRVAARRAGVPDGVVFQTGDMRELVRELEGPFDLVFSNFGGLNCIGPADVQRLGQDVARLVKPGGWLVAVVMPRMCLWESLYFLAKGRLKAAVRRWRGGPVQAPLGNGLFQATWYYGPQAFSELLGDAWDRQVVKPVGFYLPPSYLDPFFVNKPRLLNRLSELESGAEAGWAAWSDHFLVALRRRG